MRAYEVEEIGFDVGSPLNDDIPEFMGDPLWPEEMEERRLILAEQQAHAIESALVILAAIQLRMVTLTASIADSRNEFEALAVTDSSMANKVAIMAAAQNSMENMMASIAAAQSIVESVAGTHNFMASRTAMSHSMERLETVDATMLATLHSLEHLEELLGSDYELICGGDSLNPRNAAPL